MVLWVPNAFSGAASATSEGKVYQFVMNDAPLLTTSPAPHPRRLIRSNVVRLSATAAEVGERHQNSCIFTRGSGGSSEALTQFIFNAVFVSGTRTSLSDVEGAPS